MPSRIIRLPRSLYDAIKQLGRQYDLTHDDTSTRYAEIARALLISELLRRGDHHEPIDVCVAAAVASNATMILSGAFANLTYTLQADLEHLSSTTTDVDRRKLRKARNQSVSEPRKRGPNPAPIIHLTFDDWLGRELSRIVGGLSAEDVAQSGFHSALTLVVVRLLEHALAADHLFDFMGSYAEAIKGIRTRLLAAVANEREALRRHLR
jgi:hypothetical protein